jgi:soluble lytic murein transglycosylase-like protein
MILIPSTFPAPAAKSAEMNPRIACVSLMDYVYGGIHGEGSFNTIVREISDMKPRLSKSTVVSYAKSVLIASEKYGIDPVLILAVIREESNFNTYAVSYADAVGLMQIIPPTGKHLAKTYHVKWEGVDTLTNSRINILLGTAYLKELLGQFDNNVHDALTAYNMGPARLRYLKANNRYRGSSGYSRLVLGRYASISEHILHYVDTFKCSQGLEYTV